MCDESEQRWKSLDVQVPLVDECRAGSSFSAGQGAGQLTLTRLNPQCQLRPDLPPQPCSQCHHHRPPGPACDESEGYSAFEEQICRPLFEPEIVYLMLRHQRH